MEFEFCKCKVIILKYFKNSFRQTESLTEHEHNRITYSLLHMPTAWVKTFEWKKINRTLCNKKLLWYLLQTNLINFSVVFVYFCMQIQLQQKVIQILPKLLSAPSSFVYSGKCICNITCAYRKVSLTFMAGNFSWFP